MVATGQGFGRSSLLKARHFFLKTNELFDIPPCLFWHGSCFVLYSSAVEAVVYEHQMKNGFGTGTL
jgi:hypothetical protein